MDESSRANEAVIVTAFEHHQDDGSHVDIAVLGSQKWVFLTVDEARDLANQLLDAVALAEECSKESEVPLRTS
jgi:hypothetical protein